MKNKKESVIFGRETIEFYFGEIKKYKVTFLLELISIPLAAVILDTVVPYLISLAIERLTIADFAGFQNQMILVGVVAICGVAFNLLGFQSAVTHESAVRADIANSTMRNLLGRDQGFFANQKIGALTGKYIDFVNGHAALQDFFIGKIIIFTINTILGLILIGGKAPILVFVLLSLIIGLLLQVRISKKLKAGLKKQRKMLIAEANGMSADIIANSSTVKVFAAENDELMRLADINDKFKKVYRKDFRWQSIEGSTRILVMQIMQVVAIIMVGKLYIDHEIALGTAIFVIIYLQKMASQLFSLGEILFGYEKIMLQASPMTEILMEPTKVIDTSNKKLKVVSGNIEFRKVDYAYDDNLGVKVLDGFDLSIKPGQKVGLIGYSGAGKTTLTKLLLRFDDLSSGKIYIDGQDIACVTQKSLRQAISYVPQEPLLFHRSLRENIAYGCVDANDEMIMRAVKLANASEFIEKLPNGLDTIVGERGIKLSGGQRQRVAIARAILKDAQILILDEATSALDSESEALIQKSFANLMAGRTSIVVAHRLSTISKLDRIIVMDRGAVVEDGTHDELLGKNGKYAKLWRHQSGGFIE